MKPEARNAFGWVAAFLPVGFLLGCRGPIDFMITAARRIIEDKHIAATGIPAPTKLLLANAGLASTIPLCLALVFGLVLWAIKRRAKEESDRRVFELLAHNGIWVLGFGYFGSVAMAAFLPWAIAINR